MTDILIFLLKASAGVIVMYLFFFIFNRSDISFRWNRFILLLCLILPLLLPVLKFHVTDSNNLLSTGRFITTIVTGENQSNPGTTPAMYFNNPQMILMLIWAAGALLMFIRLMKSLVHTSFIIRRAECVNGGFPGLLLTSENVAPFSFYPFAVIPGYLLKEDGDLGELHHHLPASELLLHN